MTTTEVAAPDVVTYPAPHGASDFHQIANQLATDHPRNMLAGRWKIRFTGTHYEFTWITSD
jgi:hypothetical protein